MIKQKEDTIFFKNRETAGTWSILYNFATPPGQNWVTNFPASAATTASFLVTVDSVKTVTINGVPLRQLKVRYFNGPSGVDTTYITERIGCHHYLFNFYGKYCETDQPWFKEFICYKDTKLGDVQIGQKSCSYAAQINETQSEEFLFRLSPNPASQQLQIQLNQEHLSETQLCIYDVTGTPILEFMIPANTRLYSFPVSALRTGLYFIRTVNNHSQDVSRKLVVVNE